jgi:hypothetical protein
MLAGLMPGSSVQAAAAQEPDGPAPPVRRIYIPADRIKELTAEYPELRTMSRQDFDALERRARSSDSGAPILPQIESSKYQAHLEGGRLVGSAELTVRGRPSDRTLLRWPAGAWTISAARWEDAEASIGYAGRGELGLIVPAADAAKLTFAFAAAGRHSEIGNRFELKFPLALRGELSLELPRGLVPIAPGALVSGPSDAHRPELQQWRLSWQQSGTLRLDLRPGDGAQPVPPLVAYRRDMAIDLAEEGSEIALRLLVNAAHQPVQQLQLDCSPGVRVLSAAAPVRDFLQLDRQVILDLAEPLLGTTQLTLRALAPGPAGGRWSLPRLEIRQGFWIGGRTQIRTAAGLELFDIQIRDGRLAATEHATDRPELTVEHDRAGSQLSARVALDRPHALATVRTTLDVGPPLYAVAIADWQVVAGELNELQLRAPRGWFLETIHTSPPGLVADWFESDAGDATTVTLRPSRPISAGSTFSVRVHLAASESDAGASAHKCVLPRLQPIGAHATQETVAVHAGEAWSVELVEAAEVSVIPSDPIGVAANNAPVLVYRFDGPAGAGKLVMHRRPTQLAARVIVNVDAALDRIAARYTFDVESIDGQAERIDVHFHERTGEELEWDLPDGFRAERLDVVPTDAVEVWRIWLPRSAPRQFSLSASWSAPTAGAIGLPLPTLAQVTTLGQIVLTNRAGATAQTTPRDLLAWSNAGGFGAGNAAPAGASGVRRQSWRYSGGSPQLQISVSPAAPPQTEGPWIARTLIETLIDSSGNALHRIRYDVRYSCSAAAADRFALLTIDLPPGALLRQAVAAGQAIAWADGGALRVPCPVGEEPFPVQIEYSMPGREPTGWATLDIPLPKINLPAMGCRWTVHCAPDYAVVDWPDRLTPMPPRQARSTLQRLFGPLARSSGGMFRFWSGEAWRSAVQRADPSTSELAKRLESSFQQFARVRPRERTWRRLIVQLDAGTDGRIVIDTVGIGQSPVAWDSLVPLGAEPAKQELVALLRTADLELLLGDRAAVLSSRSQASELGVESAGWCTLRGDAGLVRAVDQALLHDGDSAGRFVASGAWEPSQDGESVNALATLESQAGGAVWHFQATDYPSSISLRIVRAHWVRAASVGVAGLALLLALRLPGHLGRLRLALCGFGAGAGFVLASLVPDAVAAPLVVFAWCSLALPLVWVLRGCSHRARGGSTQPAATLPSTVTQLGAVGAAMLLALALPPSSAGEVQMPGSSQPDAPAAARQPAAARSDLIVFIPYDPAQLDKLRDASRVLVPRPVWDVLQARTTAAALGEQCLVRAASYTGRLGSDRLDLQIEFELENPAEGPATCTLPLPGLLVQSAELDGRPCTLRPEGDGLAVEIRDTGGHRLRLAGVVPIAGPADAGAVELVIPPVPASRLDLEAPPDVTVELQPPAPHMTLDATAPSRRLQADLGAIARLPLNWRRGESKPAALRADSASVFSWSRAAQKLHTRCNVHVDSGSVTRLALDLDPRLVLEQVAAPNLAGYRLRPEAAQLLLEFERPVTKQVGFALQFLLREQPPTGPSGSEDKRDKQRLTIPQARVAGAQPGVRLFAIRAEAGGAVQVPEGQGVSEATAEEFQSAWGDAAFGSAATVFRRLDEAAGSLDVVVIAAGSEPRLRAETEIEVQAGRSELVAQLFAAAPSGVGFRHELLLPAGLKPSRVQSAVGTHWKVVATDRLLWFGSGSDELEPFIKIEGWVPLSPAPSPLPLVRPAPPCGLAGQLTIRSGPNLDVHLVEPRGLSRTHTPDDAAADGEARAGLVYRIDSADCAATLVTTRRSPSVSATVATRVLLNDEGVDWITVIDYEIADGSVDALELRVPGDTGLPIQFHADDIRRRGVRVERDEQVWTMEFAAPRENSYRVLLQGREQWPDGGFVLRHVVPQGVRALKRYLLVLDGSGRRVDVGGASELQAMAPEDFARWFSEPLTQNVVGAWQLDSAAPIELVYSEAERPAQPSSVLLERHQSRLETSGTVATETRLLVRSRAAGELPLALPPAARLLELWLNGEPVEAAPGEQGRLLVRLDRAERLLELVIRWSRASVPAAGAANRLALTLPQLTDSHCPRVWTVYAPDRSSASPGTTTRSMAEAVAAEALLEELERTVASRGFDTSDRAATIVDSDRLVLASLATARRVGMLEMQIGTSDSKRRAETDRARRWIDQLAQRHRERTQRFVASLQATRSPAAHGGTSPVSSDAARATGRDMWRMMPTGTPHYFVSRAGTDEEMTVSFGIPGEPPTLAAWAIAGIGGFLGAGGFCWLLGLRRQHVVLLLLLLGAGLFWCWRLEPGPLGAIPLLAAAALALRGLLQRLRTRRPDLSYTLQPPSVSPRT